MTTATGLGLIITLRDDTPGEMAARCQLYWQVNEDDGTFAHTVKDICQAKRLCGGSLLLKTVNRYSVAITPQVTCRFCDEAAEVRSRASYRALLPHWGGLPPGGSGYVYLCDRCQHLPRSGPPRYDHVPPPSPLATSPVVRVSSVPVMKHRMEVYGRVGYVYEYPGGKAWARLETPNAKLGSFASRAEAESAVLSALMDGGR